LAAKLGLQVNSNFGQGAEAQLMREVLGLSGTVLICWEHHAIIGGILPAIPSVRGRVPEKWNGDRFDVVLRFDGISPSGPFTFRELHPCLLHGDLSVNLG
jgi:hypothetical protein